MQAEVLVFLSPRLRQQFDETEALKQLADAATLPGVVSPLIGMPDIHTGFGLPIGGVMAIDARSGVVSAGAVGMDINCGVRLLSSHLDADALGEKELEKLLAAVNKRVPAGVGKASLFREFRESDLETVCNGGAAYFIRRGYGLPEDKMAIEAGGALPGASLSAVSHEARERSDQLATIGGGNHFIEIGKVERVFWPEGASIMGLEEGTITVLIHTGSRGFGHQICTDYSNRMARAAAKYGLRLPSKGLAAAPVDSVEGREYLAAMACAANFAFANRQLITFLVREAFEEVLKLPLEEMGLDLVYDVAHNIAKFEEHGGRKLLVHRKGATRALPAGHPEVPARYRAVGQPAIIPGSMGTASYVVVGTGRIAETFNSVNHGAGRVMSRKKARTSLSVEEFRASMQGVLVRAKKLRSLLDEAPLAYKDIDEVVGTLVDAGLTRPVVRLKPLAVMKGEGDEA
ncbi:MAG TPA: RNA-splicing ligase RtcB [Peptococcaceae bacterium]|nr:RNA-splicing ligase RtcB [Peptococcaceae bacterium]